MLKYNENYVWLHKDTGTYQLIQNKYSIEKLSYTSFTNKIVAFTIGDRSIDSTLNPALQPPLEEAEDVEAVEDVEAEDVEEAEDLEDE